ncbi:hypothetical protein GS501_03815 [Saccharibacter sp. 17.LH.SD]|uniref:hypothetical protein n=1 Tax=Saccharibacter sp. 17.LH.SD TaxID=2689393 RepID=UPI001369F74B|nr:hypothetical protein [Saccharibacter sp. 17.LH.SD]MXV44181.1 hypothetical protein [Saccharibacter sp. 17.LH.SD]
MTRNNRLLLSFVIIVLVPVIIVWYTVWPILRGIDFPNIVSGEELSPVEHVLTSSEATMWDTWLHAHRSGWGAKGETPPTQTAGRIMMFKGPKGEEVILSLWHFRHHDDVAGLQFLRNGPYRMRSFGEGGLLPLIQGK